MLPRRWFTVTIGSVLILLLLLAALPSLRAQTVDQVLLVVNRRDAFSSAVGDYYRVRRQVPAKNVCTLDTAAEEEISWATYEQQVEKPVADCLRKSRLEEKVLYVALAMAAPLKVSGGGSGIQAEYASVESELALLYRKIHGVPVARAGGISNPFFGRREEPFRHPRFPIYLVTRLAAYDLPEAKGMIDRSLAARNHGKFVIDLSPSSDQTGNNWLRNAALLLPAGRVVLDQTVAVVAGERDVIGYAAWGSNDSGRSARFLHFQWLPGAIAMEFVSTDARTLMRPPEEWHLTTWLDKKHFFGGSPQTLSADYLHEGATAATGNAYEPFLSGCARPDYLLPAYFEGRTLAESYYLSVPLLSWQGVLLGDPLTTLGAP